MECRSISLDERLLEVADPGFAIKPGSRWSSFNSAPKFRARDRSSGLEGREASERRLDGYGNGGAVISVRSGWVSPVDPEHRAYIVV